LIFWLFVQSAALADATEPFTIISRVGDTIPIFVRIQPSAANAAFADTFNFDFNFSGSLVAIELASSEWFTNSWMHVGCVFDGSFVYVYINGTLVRQVPATGSLAATIDPLLTVGQLSGLGVYQLKGKVADIRWTNEVISYRRLSNPTTVSFGEEQAIASDGGDLAITSKAAILNANKVQSLTSKTAIANTLDVCDRCITNLLVSLEGRLALDGLLAISETKDIRDEVGNPFVTNLLILDPTQFKQLLLPSKAAIKVDGKTVSVTSKAAIRFPGKTQTVTTKVALSQLSSLNVSTKSAIQVGKLLEAKSNVAVRVEGKARSLTTKSAISIPNNTIDITSGAYIVRPNITRSVIGKLGIALTLQEI
jgi:hypothetical protein